MSIDKTLKEISPVLYGKDIMVEFEKEFQILPDAFDPRIGEKIKSLNARTQTIKRWLPKAIEQERVKAKIEVWEKVGGDYIWTEAQLPPRKVKITVEVL